MELAPKLRSAMQVSSGACSGQDAEDGLKAAGVCLSGPQVHQESMRLRLWVDGVSWR